MKTLLLYCGLISYSLFAQAEQIELKLSETGTGLDHTVIIESPGMFKLGFENGLNYGLSQWFDLVNDPQAKVDISHNYTDYLSAHAQGALFNQCLNPDDLIGHVASAKLHFKDTPRSIKIIESGPVRVIVENSYHPMLGKQNKTLLFNTRYVIYPTGKMFIKNIFTALKPQTITLWRNSILGVGDPAYSLNADKGIIELTEKNVLTDKTKKWKLNQWKGYQITLPGWNSFEIAANTETTITVGKQLSGGKPLSSGEYTISTQRTKYGWLRGDSVKFPKTWHNKSSDFILACWDKTTPKPYSEWTKASVMLTPFPNNPKQGGGAGLHGWSGYKRTYYEYGKFEMKQDEKITQYYMINLGAENSEFLPNIISKEIAKTYADDYRQPVILKNGEFSKQNGCYILNNHKIDFDAAGIERIYPVFQLTGNSTPKVKLNNAKLQEGKDYISQINKNNQVIVQILRKLSNKNTLEFSF